MTSGPRRVDPVDSAHLTGRSRPSPPVPRYLPSDDLTDLVERYWLPSWSVSAPSRQSTLQHPVCLIVVSDTYARFYGVVRGLSTVVLEGEGWAAGVMLAPAAGRLLLGRSVATVTDRVLELEEIAGLDADGLVADIREAMAYDPGAESGHLAAVAAYERRLRAWLPVDEQGLLVNRVVAWLRDHPEVTRVDEVAATFGLGERTLQRLAEQRLGISPKWLIQRRRLHDAVHHLKGAPAGALAGSGLAGLAGLAAELGYVDQAHFTRDFRQVTGMTPGKYLADQG